MFRHTRETCNNSYRRIHAAIAILMLTMLWGAVSALPAAAQTTDPSGTTTCAPEDPTCDPTGATTSGANGQEPPPGGGTDEWDTDVLNSPLRSPGLPPEPTLWPALRQAVRQALRDLFGAGPLDRISTEGGR